MSGALAKKILKKLDYTILLKDSSDGISINIYFQDF